MTPREELGRDEYIRSLDRNARLEDFRKRLDWLDEIDYLKRLLKDGARLVLKKQKSENVTHNLPAGLHNQLMELLTTQLMKAETLVKESLDERFVIKDRLLNDNN